MYTQHLAWDGVTPSRSLDQFMREHTPSLPQRPCLMRCQTTTVEPTYISFCQQCNGIYLLVIVHNIYIWKAFIPALLLVLDIGFDIRLEEWVCQNKLHSCCAMDVWHRSVAWGHGYKILFISLPEQANEQPLGGENTPEQTSFMLCPCMCDAGHTCMGTNCCSLASLLWAQTAVHYFPKQAN